MVKIRKIFLLFVFCVLTVSSYSLENADSTRHKLKAGATFSINSNGIASVPAFSLGRPAVMASVNLAKSWFSYDPTLAYGLDGRPWFIDNWFHVKLINKTAFELRTGVNISSYCSKFEVPDGEVLHVERYFAFELAGTYHFSPVTSLLLSYWSDNGQEAESLKGHYINLVGERSDIPLGTRVLLAVDLQVFYINYTGENDGLFVAPRIAASIRKIPFSLFFQATQSIVSNIEPFPGFNWNVGLAYSL